MRRGSALLDKALLPPVTHPFSAIPHWMSGCNMGQEQSRKDRARNHTLGLAKIACGPLPVLSCLQLAS